MAKTTGNYGAEYLGQNGSQPQVPEHPDEYYRGNGWKGWRDFLGVSELDEVKGKTCVYCGKPAVDLVLRRPACGECLEKWCGGIELEQRA